MENIIEITKFPNEIFFKIVFHLDYKYIKYLCQKYPIYNKLCNTEYFWKNKIIHDFNSEFAVKPYDETYKKLYESPIISEYINKNDHKINIMFSNLDIQSKIIDNFDINRHINQTLKPGTEKTFFYLNKKCIKLKLHDKINLIIGKSENDSMVIKDYSQLINYVDNTGNISILNQFNNFELDIVSKFIFNRKIDSYVIDNKIELVNWLYLPPRNIIPSSYGVSIAAKFGHFDLLKHLYKFGYKFNVEIANEAATGGQLEILKWLSSYPRNVLPDEEGACNALVEEFMDVLKWLAEHNIIISETYLKDDFGDKEAKELIEILDNNNIPHKD